MQILLPPSLAPSVAAAVLTRAAELDSIVDEHKRLLRDPSACIGNPSLAVEELRILTMEADASALRTFARLIEVQLKGEPR